MQISSSLACLLLFSSACLSSQTVTSTQFFPAQPLPNHPSFPKVGDPVTIVAPLFVQSEKLSTSLVIVNNSESLVGTSIRLINQSGASVAQSHITLKPHEQQVIAIAALLSRAGVTGEVGSVRIVQDESVKSKSIAAQLEIRSDLGSIPAYVDEEFSMPVGTGSQYLRAVTDETDGDPLVAVLNTSVKPQQIRFRCLKEKAEATTAYRTLQPNGSLLLSACSAGPLDTLSSSFRGVTRSADRVTSGIEVLGDGEVGTLAAFALAPHSKNGSLVLSGAVFFDPASLSSPTTVFVGVPMGSQATLPDGIYVPQLSLANFSSAPAHVTVSLADSAAVDVGDAEPAGSNQMQRVRLVTVPPRRTVELILQGGNAQSGLLHSVHVSSDRLPGEVGAKIESRGDGALFAVELLGKDEGDINNSGLHPWSLEGDDQSYLLLYNHGVQDQTFDILIHASDSQVWDKKYRVAPHQTRQLSFRDIIIEKVKDDRGRVLRDTALSGTVNWMIPDSMSSTGRLMVSNRSEATAKNYSCGNFTVICGLIVSTYDNDLLPIDYYSSGYSGNPQFCNSYSPQQCYGNSTGGGSANITNSIGPSNVIRFNSSSDVNSASPNVFGVGAGSGSANMQAVTANCQAGGSPNPPPFVQIPTADRIVSSTASHSLAAGQSPCPVGQAGWYRQVVKINTDQQKPPHDVSLSGQGMTESVTIGTPNGLNIARITQGSATTNVNGQYQDTFYGCSAVCPKSAAYTAATQTVMDNFEGSLFKWVNALKYSCTAITENGN